MYPTLPRYTAGEQKYEDAKAEAEEQLARVGITLEARKRVKDLEIAQLTAQLRKAEMNVSSSEEEIDQKVNILTCFQPLIIL